MQRVDTVFTPDIAAARALNTGFYKADSFPPQKESQLNKQKQLEEDYDGEFLHSYN